MPDNSLRHAEAMARAQILDALAQAFHDPAILAGVGAQSELEKVLRNALQTLGSAACRRALFTLADLPPAGAEALRQRFQRLVYRSDARPLPLSESLALNGRLVSPTTDAVLQTYSEFGVQPQDELPDAAPVELSFLAYLVEAEAEAWLMEQANEARRLRSVQRRFLNDHVLAWLPALGQALARSADPHLAMLGQLLRDFLKEEQLRVLVGDAQKTQGDIPLIPDAGQCGLCGFCVQTCPTSALWIAENDSESALLLKPEHCIGCAKCLSVCPDDALTMSARPDALPTIVVLRQSQRAHCPRCGTATVSQAELEAVFTRLEAGESLRYRLSLCESCKGSR